MSDDNVERIFKSFKGIEDNVGAIARMIRDEARDRSVYLPFSPPWPVDPRAPELQPPAADSIYREIAEAFRRLQTEP